MSFFSTKKQLNLEIIPFCLFSFLTDLFALLGLVTLYGSNSVLQRLSLEGLSLKEAEVHVYWSYHIFMNSLNN